MLEFVRRLFDSNFMPHGMCYQWDPRLMWLHAVSDALIAVAYYAIPFVLIYLVRKRSDLGFKWIFVLFGAFILACGTTHLFNIWNIWHGDYWVSGGMKALTAGVSLATGVMLFTIVPEIMSLPRPTDMKRANDTLARQASLLKQGELLAHIGHWRLTLDTQHLEWSDEVYRIYGVAPEGFDLTLENALAAYHPEDRAYVSQVVADALAQGEDFSFERRIVRPDGEVRYVFSKGQGEYDDEGQMVALFGVVMDITPYKLAQAEIQQLNEELEQRVVERTRQLEAVHAQYQHLFESANDAICVFDPATDLIVEANKAACDIYGFSHDELVGLPLSTLAVETEAGPTQLSETLKALPSVDLEMPQRRKDGTSLIMLVSASRVEFNGQPAILCIKRDITERKQMEEALRESEERLQYVLQSIRDVVWLADGTGQLLFINDATEDIFGTPTQAFFDDPNYWLSVLHPEDQPRMAQATQRLGAQGEIEVEYRIVRPDGEVRWLLDKRFLELDAAGQARRMGGVGSDITKMKEVETRMRQYNQQLRHKTAQVEAANQELEAFSYSVSHDLRAPLRGVAGFAQMLETKYGEQLDAQAQHYLARIRANVDQMNTLIQDLLEFSRLSRKELSRRTVEPRGLVEDVLADLEAALADRQVTLEIGPLPPCEADPALLKQVFANLLGNAVKYTQQQAEAVIRVAASEEEGITVYSVADNGVGFDMAYADKLFGVFQRLHRAEDFEGTGVGLAIVHRIVERHGGRIWAEATLGQGATFFFTLNDPSA